MVYLREGGESALLGGTRVQTQAQELLHDLLKHQVVRHVLGHIRVSEFQKRDLPYAHILLNMASEVVPRCITDYD